jgi:hypothetical protein
LQLYNCSLQYSQNTISALVILFIEQFIRKMNEYFLHTVWNHQSFLPFKLKTQDGKSIIIHNKGTYNHTNGPDFKSAEISIDHELMKGDVEIHIKSSDWVNHKHHTDKAYDQVVLHVVFDDDKTIFKSNGSTVYTLELKNRLNALLAHTVQQKKELLCSDNVINKDIWNHQLNLGLQQRYHRKQREIESVLRDEFLGDWWLTAVWILLKSFLGNHNGSMALELVKNLNKRILLTCNTKQELSSYILGMANLLPRTSENYNQLFLHLKFRYQLRNSPTFSWKYKQVRPTSFPEIRLIQFAEWLFNNRNSMDHWIAMNSSIDEFRQSFLTESPCPTNYPMGESKINAIILNGFLLLQFCKTNPTNAVSQLIANLKRLPSEKNTIAKKFSGLLPHGETALESQQILSQYQEFCSVKNCLNCLVGCEILGRTSMK